MTSLQIGVAGIGVLLLMLTLPVFLPFFEASGLDMIWIGVIVVKYVEISLSTPPVGLNAFVIKGVVGDTIPLGTIFRGLTWFLMAEIVIVAILFLFPEASLYIPHTMAN